MAYNTLRSAIPKYWIQRLSNTELETAVNHLEYNIAKIITLDKVSNIVYRKLIKKEVFPKVHCNFNGIIKILLFMLDSMICCVSFILSCKVLRREPQFSLTVIKRFIKFKLLMW